MEYKTKNGKEKTRSLNKLETQARATAAQEQSTVTTMSTHIRISHKNYKKLTELGKKNESYDDIISRLIEFYENEPHHKAT
jgi:hypothetical protein